jgi:hypothetical protein
MDGAEGRKQQRDSLTADVDCDATDLLLRPGRRFAHLAIYLGTTKMTWHSFL